jgi:hypothetical protein
MAVKLAGLISGALAAAIRQLVLAGLPTTHVLMFLLACLFMALPTAEKMAPLSWATLSTENTARICVQGQGAKWREKHLEQIAALHSWPARLRANKASKVSAFKSDLVERS